MTATTDFLPFATGGGAAVEDQATWVADNYAATGFPAGILPKEKINKALRQTSSVAAALTQVAANRGQASVLDDGNMTNLMKALLQAFAPNTYYLEDQGAVGDGVNYTADTNALAILSQIPNARIVGDPSKTYYFAAGVSNASGVTYENIRAKIKLGTGGFSSIDFGASTRYATSTTLLYWQNSEGGGITNCEFFGDGGGDFVCQPVAVRGGMTSKPFKVQGVVNIHDLPGVSNCFSVHGIGIAGMPIDTLVFSNIGTNQASGAANAYGPQGYWKNNGAYGASDITQVSCFVVDTDCLGTTTSYGITAKRIFGRNIYCGGNAYAKSGWQSDLVTIGRNSSASSSTEHNHGIEIDHILAFNVNEVVDCQQANVHVGRIDAVNVAACFKVGYLGANSGCDDINVTNLALWAAVFYGGGSGPVADIDGAYVGKITGRNPGGYTIEQGNASASTTSSTFVLGTYASPSSGIDNYYSQGPYKGAIWITSGTGAGQVRQFTGYTASSKTCTGLQDIDTGSASNWTVTPDATSTYVITPYGRIFGAAITSDSTSKVTNSTIDNIAIVDNLGRLAYITYTNVASNNNCRFTVERDLGFLLGFAGVSGSAGPCRTLPGPALKSMCEMTIAGGNQTISSTSATLVLFGSKRADNYDIPGSQGVQGSPSENGIRVRSPGPKTFRVKLGWTLFTAGAFCTVAIYRNGALVESKQFTAPTGAGSGPWNTDVSFTLLHAETYKDFRNGGGNENLYQVYVTNSVTGMVLDASTASCTSSFVLEG